MIIAVDGTLASGKGTVARGLAQAYGLPHLDTGALYRAVAVRLLDAGADPANPDAAEKAAHLLDPAAIDETAIRTAEAGAAASVVAAQPRVRAPCSRCRSVLRSRRAARCSMVATSARWSVRERM